MSIGVIIAKTMTFF